MELLHTKEQIEKVVTSIYGEERSWVYDEGDLIYIIIHFPEINMTNSKGHKHTILDMYVRIEFLYIEKGSEINFSGTRTTYSLNEWNSSYCHSHLSNAFNIYRDFCLGSPASDNGSHNFASLKLSLEEKPSEHNWELFLLSIPGFLSWESIEGGPYIHISSIQDRSSRTIRISGQTVQNELQRIVYLLPQEVWQFTPELSLIPDHPLLYDFFDKESSLRSLVIEAGNQNIKDLELSANKDRNSEHGKWKNTRIPIKIIGEEKVKKEDKKQIDNRLVQEYITILNDRAKTIFKKKQYERIKQQSPSFGTIAIIQQTTIDRNKEPAAAD